MYSPFGSSGIEDKAGVVAADRGTGNIGVSAKVEHKIREFYGASRTSRAPRRLVNNSRGDVLDEIANKRE